MLAYPAQPDSVTLSKAVGQTGLSTEIVWAYLFEMSVLVTWEKSGRLAMNLHKTDDNCDNCDNKKQHLRCVRLGILSLVFTSARPPFQLA